MNSTRCFTNRRGFALLMALVLVALTGLLLAKLSQRALAMGQRAADQVEDLKLRWATKTLEQAIAYHATHMLSRELQGQETRPPHGLPLKTEAVLDGLRIGLVIDDDAAKLNLNRVFALAGANGLTRSLVQLGMGDVAATIPGTSLKGEERLASWGQVFSPELIPGNVAPAHWIMMRTGNITLWGNGKININRASDAVVEAACQLAIGPVKTSRLISLRSDEPLLKLDELLTKVELDPIEAGRAKAWLSESTELATVWMTVSNARKRSTRLLVVNGDGETTARFRW